MADRDTQTGQWRLFLAASVTYFLHAPIVYVGAGRFVPGAPLLGLAGAGAVFLLHRRLRERSRRLAGYLSAVYWAIVLSALVVPLYFLFIIGPWYFPLPFAMAGLAFTLPRRRPFGRALFVAALAAGTLVQAASVGVAVAGVFTCLLVAWAVLLGDETLLRLPRRALVLATLGLLVSVRLIAFLDGVPLGEAQRVNSQTGVRILATPEDLAGPRGLAVDRTQIRFVHPSCDGRELYIGTRGRATGLYRIEAQDGSVTASLDLPGDVSDNLVTDCQAGRIYVGSYGGGKVFEVDPRSWTIRRKLALPGTFVGVFRLSKDGRLLYMIPDDSPSVILIDTTSFSIIGRTSDRQANSAMVLDEERGRLVRVTNAGRVLLHDRFSLGVIREKRVSGQLYFNVALDASRDRLLVDCMSSGRLFALDRDSLATVRKGRAERGLRFVHLDGENDLLWAGNFFTGELVALDPETFAQRACVRVGVRPRWLEPSADGRSLLVASGVGAVSVDLEQVIGK